MGAAIAFPGFILTLASFILLLLNTLSVPIIKSLYFLSIYVNNNNTSLSSIATVSGSLNLGTLGYCSTGIDATVTSTSINSIFGGSSGVTNGTTEILIAAGCTSAKLGYQLDSSLFSTLESVAGVNLSGIDTSLIKSLSYVMVLQVSE